ncbi:hypothetical protein BH10BDE1_BH10BDE1_20950 [soil metagenome]
MHRVVGAFAFYGMLFPMGLDAVILSDTVLYGEVGNPRYMGPYIIASSLRDAGYSATVLDFFTRFKSHEAFFEYLGQMVSFDTKIIGISSTFLAPFVATLEPRSHRSTGLDRYYSGELFLADGESLAAWLRTLKQMLAVKAPNAKIVLGGVKSQFAVWRPEFYRDVDFIVLGAGDRAVVEVMKHIVDGTPLATRELNGQKVVDNTLELSEKSCPEMTFIAEDCVGRGEALPLEVARGCVFNCKFCHYEKKQSNKKPLDVLRRELIRNYDLFGTTAYTFCDDCFNDHPKKVEAYCELFMSLPFKIEWTAYARVDVAVAFPHTLDLMIQSGARGLYWGIESFDGDVARRAGKGTPPDKVKDFLIKFRDKYRGECLSEGSFIIGLPGETRESLNQTLAWLIKEDVFDLVTFGPLGLMPYSSNLDKVVFDYAAYSREPEKHGFKTVSFKPHFWEHEQMNSIEAGQIASEMSREWREFKKPGLLRTIWFYPHLQSLGFSREEIALITKDFGNIESWTERVAKRFADHVEDYHVRLLKAVTASSRGASSFHRQSETA